LIDLSELKDDVDAEDERADERGDDVEEDAADVSNVCGNTYRARQQFLLTNLFHISTLH
jgi:hypothetical protein